jgi:membrane-associated phospholipid phosphatase
VSLSSDVIASPKTRARAWIVIAAFAAIFVAALFADIPVSTWAHDTGIAAWLKTHVYIAHIIRFPGNFNFALIASAVLLWMATKTGARPGKEVWQKIATVLLAGIFSGVNAFLKWCVGRIRPYHGVPLFQLHPFGRNLLDAEAGFSFPSGDASLAFALAVSLSIVAPKWWPLWWTLAIIVGLERIAENAHYPSDVVAGAALGTAVAILAAKIVRTWGKTVTTSPSGDI